jgi:hypothetical protein
MAEAVVDAVQVLDQQVAIARCIAKQRQDLFPCLGIYASALRNGTDFAFHREAYYQPAV